MIPLPIFSRCRQRNAIRGPVTWNPSDISLMALSNSNRTAIKTGASGNTGIVRATQGYSTGKWYWEVHVDIDAPASGEFGAFANLLAPDTNYIGSDNNGWGYLNVNGTCYHNALTVSGLVAYSTGDVIGVCLDMGGGFAYFSKNNVFAASQDPVTGHLPVFSGITGTVYPAMQFYNTGGQGTANFASGDLVYAPPAGYLSLY